MPLALAGCGGGGGTAAGGTGEEIRPVIRSGGNTVFHTAEYRANYGLEPVNAAAAYVQGATGAGVKIAVIDSGIDTGHPDLVGAVDPASADIVARPSPDVNGPGDHGTRVAVVAAARKNDWQTHGVAYNATVLAVRADTEGSCATSCTFTWDNLAAATDYAVANGARVINYSLGGSAAMSPAFEQALRDAVAQGRILVMAAGNSAGADPLNPATFAARPEAEGLALAIGAIDQDYVIASFSNRAGSAQSRYLVAPGIGVVTSGAGGGTVTVDGTSFAAPHVAGAAAVLIEAAPHLTARQVVDLLLSTATDLGVPGTDPVYGRGLVDLGAALAPQGILAVPAGATVAAGGLPAAATTLRLGAAFGDALSGAPALREAVALDSLGRAYRVDLSGAVRRHDGAPDLAQWIAAGPAVETTRLAAGPGVSLTVAWTPADRAPPGDEGPAHGPAPRSAVSASFGEAVAVGIARGYRLGDGLAPPGLAVPFLGRDAHASPWLGLAGAGDSAILRTRLGGGLSFELGVAADRPAAEAEGPARPRDRGSRSARTARLVQSWPGGAALSLGLGTLTERGSLLDAAGDGALATGPTATTRFLGLAGALPVAERITLYGSYGLGWTEAETAPGSLVRDIAGLRSEAFGAAVELRGAFAPLDRLGLSVSRPLRVAAGRATFDVPVGRTLDGAVLRRAEAVDLVPSGAETDIELAYRRDLPRGHVQLNALVRLEPGHEAQAGPDFAFAARYGLRF